MKDLTEHFTGGGIVYDGNFLEVHRDTVRLPDGSEGTREYVRHPGAVAVVALFDDGQVLLERQFRYPHHREFIEIPAGKLEPGEPPLETAQRELLEETGYVAADWRRLAVMQTTIAYSDETIELFLATRLTLKERKLDQGEFLEVLTLPFDEAIAMVRNGRITDSKSMIGLLFVQAFTGGPPSAAGDRPSRA